MNILKVIKKIRKTPVEKAPIVIQATMRSPLFPGKVLAKLRNGQTILEFVVSRIRSEGFPNPIVIATSNHEEDKAIAKEGERLGGHVVAGPYDDVIRRLCMVADEFDVDYFARVLGANPLLDLSSLKQLLKAHYAGDWEYTYNDHFDGVMLGTGAEIINAGLLRQLDRSQLTNEQRESGTLFIRQNSDRYRVRKYSDVTGNQWVNLWVDTAEDLERVNEIIENVPELTNKHIAAFLEKFSYYGVSSKKKPQEVGLEKLFIHPEKMQAVSSSVSGQPDLSYPISVELSLTNRCNFDCVWCSDKDLRAKSEDEMSLNVLRSLFGDLAENGTRGIVLEGGGEPTLYKEFDKVLDLIDEYGLGKGLITNGSFPLRPDQLKRFDWIRVSLDSSNMEEHKNLKGYDGFERVLGNINNYTRFCPLVGIGYVVTNRNVQDIETVVLRLKNFGVNYIQFRPVVDHGSLLGSVDLSYLKRYETSQFSVVTDGMKENMVTGNNGLSCHAHSLTSVITPDGDVFLCGRLNIYPEIKPIGNLHRNTFREIWHGEERRRQHDMVMKPEFCQKFCPQCRLTKFNELFARMEKLKTRNFI